MKYARIVDNKVEELFPTLPDFHPDFVAALIEVADAVEVGMVRQENGSFAFPVPDPNIAIFAQISALESTQTPRRIRDAVLTPAGRAWMDALELEIASLRAQLT